MAGPWEKYGTPAATPVAAPSDPIIKPRDPYKDAAERRAEEDQAFQRQSAAREAERVAMARQDQARQNEQAALGTESERTAGFLSKRIVDAVGRMSGSVKKDAGAASPTLGVEMLRGVFGDTAANYATDAERQQVRAAQIDILDSALTLGTGAAYTKEQIEGYREAYFPQLGDDPATITSKREALRSLLESARVKAGRSAPDIASAMAALDTIGGTEQQDQQQGGAVGAQSPGTLPGGGGSGGGSMPGIALGSKSVDDPALVQAGVRGAYEAMLKQGVSPDQGVAKLKELGVTDARVLRTAFEQLQHRRANPNTDLSRYNFDQVDDREVRVGQADPNQQQMEEQLQAEGFDPNSSQAYNDRLAQGILWGFGDEIKGVGGALSALFNDKGIPTGYREARDLERLKQDKYREAQGLGGTALEFLGSMAMPAPGLAQARGLGELAKQGAKYGAVGGFGAGEGLPNSLAYAGLGAAAGGVLAPAIGAGANKLASVMPRRGPSQEAISVAAPVIDAAQRRNIPLRGPDINPDVRGKAGALGQTERGRPIVEGAYADDVAAIEQGVIEAGGRGTAQDRFGVGEVTNKALTRHGDRTRTAASARYARAEKLAGDVRVEPTVAIQRLADEIVALEGVGANSNAAEIKLLRGIGEDLSAPGGKSIAELRAMRTNIRTQLRANQLDRTPAEARVLGVLESATADIEQALASNPRALSEYKAADKLWKERAQFRNTITKRLIGNRDKPMSAEDTGRAVESLFRSDGKRTVELLGQMTKEEQADIAASVAANLGRNAKGDFSLPILLNNLDARRGMVSPRSVRAIFGEDGAAALKDLQLLARTKIEASSARNTSNTGGVVDRGAKGLRSALASALGYSGGGFAGAVAAPMAERFIANLTEERAARLLMNPAITKWIRQAPESADPKVIDRHFARLSSATSKYVVSAADIEALKRALVDTVANSPGRAAAQNEPQSGNKPPQ